MQNKESEKEFLLAMQLIFQSSLNGCLVKANQLSKKQIYLLEQKKAIKPKYSFTCSACEGYYSGDFPELNCVHEDCVSKPSNKFYKEGYVCTVDYESFVKKILGPIPKDFVLTIGAFNESNVSKKLLKRKGKFFLYISPYFNLKRDFVIIDFNKNHVFLSWGSLVKMNSGFISFIRNRIFEEKNNLIKWSKIKPSKFEEIVRAIAQAKGYSKIIPGGSGPDQGKDGYAISPDGKPTLIQAKRELKKKNDSIFIQRYVTKTRRHNKNHLFLLVTGTFTGDTRTEAHSTKNPYGDVTVELMDGEQIRNFLVSLDGEEVFNKFF